LENQLYRVEIHDPGELGKAMFKWSRDNGSVVTRLTGLNGSAATVEDLGRDAVLGFNNGDWVELTDDAIELSGKPGVMAQIKFIDRANLEVQFTDAPGFGYDVKRNPKMRHWDDPASVRPIKPGANNDGFLELEAGVQVKFSPGYYNTGDYWLIPARTAGHIVEWPAQRDAVGDPLKDDQGNLVPAEQPPLGITHALACLAVVKAEVVNDAITLTQVADCRKVFPPLTEIDDPEETHRRHNRLLHGWGVACGLQVHCGGDAKRQTVRIEPGYALQSNGSELILPPPGQLFQVVEAAKKAKLLDNGKGKVVVTIAADAQHEVTLGVRASAGESDKSFWEKLLAGTFWMDVWDHCLKPVKELVEEQFVNEDQTDKPPVQASARRAITALNLGLEFVNRPQASHVFLSEQEHILLGQLYYGSKERLRDSSVYCGILDNLPQPFPGYDEELKKAQILTAFGNAAMSRVRIAPGGKVAYAFGPSGGARVCVFDLTHGEMTKQIDLAVPTGAGSLEVQDLAFYEGGQKLLVAASTSNGNSVLYRYKIVTEGQTYDPVDKEVIVKNQQVLRVSEIVQGSNQLYALVKDVGLVQFNPEEASPDAFRNLLPDFMPTGQWAFGEDVFPGIIFAVGRLKSEAAVSRFPFVCAIQPMKDGARILDKRLLDGECTDDMAILFRRIAHPMITAMNEKITVDPQLYVVLDPAPGSQSKSKRLAVFTSVKPRQLPTPVVWDLKTEGEVGLAATADDRFMLVSLANECQLRWLDPDRPCEWAKERTLPVQIHPMGLAANKSWVIAVNRDSHTLSVIPAGLISDKSSVTLQMVANYRAGLLDLARTLGLRLVQKVKDCLCEHLMRNCPDFEATDVIDLACVEIRDSRVYHIANCCRREVDTFPKLEYWLSAVPVLPLVSWAVKEFCGLVLPDLFKPPEKPSVSITPKPPVAYVPTHVLTLLRERTTAPQLKVAKDYLSARVGQVTRPLGTAAVVQAKASLDPEIVVHAHEVANGDPEDVRGRLEAKGVVVKDVTDYDKAVAAKPWQTMAEQQFDFKPGDQVNLLVRGDKVMMVTTARAPLNEGAGAPEVVKEVNRLGSELVAVQKASDAREQEIGRLNTESAQIQAAYDARDAEITRLGNELLEVQDAYDARGKEIDRLTAESAQTQAASEAGKAEITRLGAELVRVQAAHEGGEKEIERLSTESAQMRQTDAARTEEIKQLNAELVKVQAAHTARDKELNEIKVNIEKLQTGGTLVPGPVLHPSKTRKKPK
jgi:hypothetical protein